nr:YciI family protein [uncultured Chitinophaga sp.]
MASKVIPALFLLAFLVIVMVSFHPAALQSISSAVLSGHKRPAAEGGMKCYWMVFLKGGPHRDQPAAVAADIQAAHMQHIRQLAQTGKLMVAGPFGNDGDMKGIFILDCRDSLEAVQLVKEDPAVRAGRLRFEVLPWWTEKNCVFK